MLVEERVQLIDRKVKTLNLLFLLLNDGLKFLESVKSVLLLIVLDHLVLALGDLATLNQGFFDL
jgi:hypothetical protein